MYLLVSFILVFACLFSIRSCSYLLNLLVRPQTSSALSGRTLSPGDVEKRVPNAGPHAYRLLCPPTATSHARVYSFGVLLPPVSFDPQWHRFCSTWSGVGFCLCSSVSYLLDPQWRRFCLYSSVSYLLDPQWRWFCATRSGVGFACVLQSRICLTRSGVGFARPTVVSVLLVFFGLVFARPAVASVLLMMLLLALLRFLVCGIGAGSSLVPRDAEKKKSVATS